MSSISLNELHSFHTIDREIFTRLVLNLLRKPGESLLVMALWMCLESLDLPYIIQKIAYLPNGMLSALAEEAVASLLCMELNDPPMFPDGSLPLTTVIVGRRMTLDIFYDNKFTLICSIKYFLNNVCANIFTDILVHRIYPSMAIFNVPLLIPGFPHPTYGPVTIIPRPPDYVLNSKINWAVEAVKTPVDDRTMFLTFSRGYPVTEAEVRGLFTFHYGDCVESISMEPSPTSPDQSLYARLVVRDTETIDRILSDGPISKFRVNGKHVWARKFERREPF